MKSAIVIGAILAITGSIHATNYYVDASRPDDSGAGTDWATAKKSLQAGADLSDGYDTIWVTNGVYDIGGTNAPGHTLTNRVYFGYKNNITLRAVSSDPADTLIVGAPDPDTGGLGPKAVRCFYQSTWHHVNIIGFTVTNGYTAAIDDSDSYNKAAGGIYGYGAATTSASNCVIVDCHSSARGGGLKGVIVYNSVIKDCSSLVEGGGICNSDYRDNVYDTLITGNTTGVNKPGGGAFQGVYWRCTFTNNSTGGDGLSGSGGAISYATAYDCLFTYNTAKDGAVTDNNGKFYRCTFRNNHANRDGGVASTFNTHGYIFRNCLMENNSAGRNGSVINYREDGPEITLLENCTLINNQADGIAAALYGSRSATNIIATNCIIYANTDISSGAVFNYNEKVSISYSLTTPMPPTGSNNITNTPVFVSSEDRHLDWGSSGIDVGITISSMTNDLAFALRPIDGNSSGTAEYDMGCYETSAPPPEAVTILMLK